MPEDTRIVGIISVRNEAPIIETTLRHTLGQGIDRIVISNGCSTDGTDQVILRVADDFPAYTFFYSLDVSPYFVQEREMTYLALRAGLELDAAWVVPFDSDEYVYSLNGGTVAEALNAQPPEVTKLYCKVWRHHTWDLREVEPEIPRKVVFRWQSGAELTIGQHDVHNVSGESRDDVLGIRELKYRSFEHFCAKIAAQLETMRSDMPENLATHVQRFRGSSVEEMRKAWDEMMSVPTIEDPIPSTLGGLV